MEQEAILINYKPFGKNPNGQHIRANALLTIAFLFITYHPFTEFLQISITANGEHILIL